MQQVEDKMRRREILEHYKHAIRILEGVVEIIILSALYFHVWKLCYRGSFSPMYYGRGKWVLVGIYATFYSVVFSFSDGFKYGHQKFADVVISQIISSLIVNFLTYFQLCLIANKMVNVLPIMAVFVVDCIICFSTTYLYTKVYHKLYIPRDMLLIYGNDNALDLKFKMDTRQDRYTVTEIISVKSDYEELISAIKRHDAVIINDIAGIKRNDILKYCYANSVRTYIVPKISDIILEGAQDISLFDTPLKLVKGIGLSMPQRILKRTFDIILCLIAMIPCAPLILLIAAAIKL